MYRPITERGINGNCLRFRWDKFEIIDPILIFQSLKPIVLDICLREAEKFNYNIKWYVALKLKLKKLVADHEMDTTPTFHGIARTILQIQDNINEFSVQWDEAEGIIWNKIDKFIQYGSGWVINSIECFDLNIVCYKPIYSGTYVPTPKKLDNKKSTINIKNEDQRCFLWSVLAYFNQDQKNNRVRDLKKYSHLVNVGDLEFPLKIEDIPKFESLNVDICINIYNYVEECDTISPLHVSKYQSRLHKINLILLEDKHFIYIRNLSRLTLANAASSYIPTPKKLANKKSTINIKNEDQKSFLWSILAYFNENPMYNKVSNLQKYSHLVNVENLEFPVKIEKIPKFESFNEDICINVLSYEDEKDIIYPIFTSKNRGRKHTITLLFLKKQHYILVKNLSRLLSDQTEHHGKVEICPYCLHRFTKKNALANLEKHLELCSLNKCQRVRMPQEGEILKFSNYSYTLKVPYIIYADFECMIIDNIHKPCGYGYLIIDEEGEIYYGPKIVRANSLEESEKLIDNFIDELETHSVILKKKLQTIIDMNFTTEDEKTYLQQKSCCLCTKPIDFIDRVRHHSHSTGKFIGAAHNTCNLNTKKVKFIPVIFHNLTGYDMHFILKSLGNYRKKISTIAKSSEKIMTMTLNNTLRFIDSLNFLHSSLDKLVAINPEFKLLQQHYPPNKIDLLRKKQLYPYEYMNNFQKFTETELPTIDKFYSSIGDKNATVEEYEHAKTVWEVFKIENLAQFHDFYLKIDILLLADVFENFRKTFMNTYNMDVAHCYSLPHFSWSAMLKYTKVELQLISDPDQYLFFEKGIRGGISIIPHRYAKANNRYMNDFKINEPETYIIYWDCNNLYAVGMSCNLPHSNFEWMTEADIQEFNVEQDQSNVGYVLEVDLEYPRHLHNSHNDYPLAPVKEKPPNGKTEKLLTTLEDKEKYIIHINNLKLYLRLGMKLKKIHRGIKFLQSKWLEPFINLNTQLRRNACNDFERNLYKLMNNSIYGRTLMNVKKHSDFEIVTNEKRLHKLISKPRTKNWHLFGENVVGVTLNKVEIVLNKPIYVGMVILEESKAVMFDFHYNYIKKIFPNQSKVLMSDTDSFMYSIECDDIYEKIKIHGDIFDTSNYERNHMCYSDKNNKIIGKFKDELGGQIISEFVGLKPKMYSFILSDNTEEKKVAKGITKSAQEKQLSFKLYKDCLFQGKTKVVKFYSIESNLHTVTTVKREKLALSQHDNKRFLENDGISTLAFGHKDIESRKRKHVDDDH